MATKAEERLIPFEAPQCSVGAPLPTIVASEYQFRACYQVQQADPAWDGTSIRILDPDVSGEPVAIIRAEQCYAHTFGPPNDEAIEGHRLADLGLEPYSTYEIRDSRWIAELEGANRVHPYHSAEPFDALRHFIFTFHDSCLEIVAGALQIEVVDGPLRDVARRLVDEI